MPVVRDFTALLSGYSLHDTSGKGAFYTFSFPGVVPDYYSAYGFPAAGLASFRPLTEGEKSAARQALNAWASISGLTFFEVSPGMGDIQLGAYNLELLGEDPDVVGFAFYPDGRYDDLLASDIFLDLNWATDLSVLLHEIGHAIGLKHPFDGDVTLASDLDNYGHTVMSYSSGGGSSGYSLGQFDPQAIQYLYGSASADGTQVASWSWDPGTYTLTQSGGGGTDAIFGVGTGDVIAGLGGNDFIQGRGGADQLNGGDGDDEILGGAGNDIVTGALGVDDLDGGGGDDLVDGGEGDDFLYGSGGRDQLVGGGGNDTLFGEDGIDELAGGAGADIIVGGLGDDRIEGGAGDDTLFGDEGADTYIYSSLGDSTATAYDSLGDFETGIDKIDLGALAPSNVSWTEGTYSNSTDVYSFVTVTTGSGPMTLLVDGRVSLSDFILTAAPPATITGTAGDDVLQGTGRAEILRGEGGDDVLYGLGGNDSFVGGTGSDRMIGGLGHDTYGVDNVGDVIEENANEGNDLAISSVSYTLSANVEELTLSGTADINATGNGLANILYGNSGANILDGGSGADQMGGGPGNDIYIVDAGDTVYEFNDVGIDEVRTALAAFTLGPDFENLQGTSASGQALTGNALANAITGAGGDDSIDGGAGADQLAGGLGNDLYFVDSGDMVTEAAGAGTDEIRTALAAYTLGLNVENLRGTSASGQALSGNALANAITGGGGGDLIDGGAGADLLAGGLGNDIYVVDSGDGVTEEAAGGTDEVRTALAAFTLGAHIENLTGNSPSGQALTGNGLANVLTGGAGNDVLDGGTGADQLAGGLGNDLYLVDSGDSVAEAAGAGTDEVRTALSAYALAANVETLTGTSATGQALTGNGGANSITGGGGNDVIDGGAGADQLAGGLGDDLYLVDSGDVLTEAGGAGTDEVRTALGAYVLAANFENLTGTSATGQSLTGNGVANLITGGDGNDVIDGGAGADQLAGGLGNDLYFFDSGDVVVEAANAGADEIRTALAAYTLVANVEALTGLSATGQALTGNGLANVIAGGSGNDVIDGGAGADQLAGGLGNDLYLVDSGDVVTEGANAGTDEVRTALAAYTLAANVETLTGQSASGQMLIGNGLANVIAGGGGNDTLDGGAGADQLAGGLGNDIYVVDSGDSVTEAAGAGTDEVRTALAAYVLGVNFETLTGTSATGQALTGNGVANSIAGSTGNDTLDGGAGADQLAGGLGNDLYLVDSGDVVTEAANAGTDEIRTALAAYSLAANFENLTGTSSIGQALTGNGLANVIAGGSGSDTLDGGAGNDRLDGGAGGDTALYATAAAGVTVTLRMPGEAQNTAGAGLDTLIDIEHLTGSAFADTLIGNDYANVLDGRGGADILRGSWGDDVYFVDDAGDVVDELAGQGVDTIRTGLAVYSLLGTQVEILTATSDIAHDFRGNAANNLLAGGAGNDIFRLYDGGNDVVNGGAGADLIFIIGSLTAADVINAGADADTLIVQGNYAGGLTLSANVTQIEGVTILGGNNTSFGEPGTNLYDYVVTTNNANFAAGVQARINGAALLAGEDFTFNGTAETDGSFVVYGGKGKDTLTGGFGNDVFIYAEERFAPGDTVNGGPGGYDGIFFRGNYTIDFNAPGYFGLMTSIENMTLTSITDERYARGGDPAGFDYNITLADNLLLAGVELTVNGGLLTAGETMIVDGSLETDGNFRLFAGKSNDTLKGGANNDLLLGGLGADTLSGGGGADVFRYDLTADSTAASMDHILDFTPGTDKIELSRVDANTLVAGDQAFSWIGSNAFSNVAGQLRAFQQGGEWILQGDTDGDGIADLLIALTLQGPTPLGAGEFLL